MSKKIVCSSPDCKHGCIRKVVYGDKVLCWDCYQEIPSSIRSPAVKLREETMMNENMLMKNAYEIRGDVTAIILNSPKNGRLETLIDTKDLDKVKGIKGTWCAQWSRCTKSFYVFNSVQIDNVRKRTLLHRFITDPNSELVVDHINHDTLDNRRTNLRNVTQAQNAQNRKGASRSNKSTGVIGVIKGKKHKKYQVLIRYAGKARYVGSYSDLDDARKASETARARFMPYSQEAMIRKRRRGDGKLNNL